MFRKLSFELLLGLLIALAAGTCIYFPLREGLYSALDSRLNSIEYNTRVVQKSGEQLQRYVDEHNLAGTDRKSLDDWCNTQSGLVVFLWRNGRLLYGTGISQESSPDIILDTGIQPAPEADETTRTIQFSDGTATAEFYFYNADYFYLMANGAAALAAFLAIVAVLLLLVRRKTGYIVQMERELKILEGGDLSYSITVRGADELARLAQGIDDMRRSIIEREQREEAARASNHALITAMSHDLRTPLTALIGYLDLIREGKCDGPAQEEHFIQVSRDKAFQIKELSDKLFEYFLVYDTTDRPVELEDVDAWELLSQVVEEGLFDLETRGFHVERAGGCPACRIRVDIDLFRRLFGNLFSNIEKYADRSQPITAHYGLWDGGLKVCICNGIPPACPRVESTQIGLKTCEKIMEDHGGRFQIQQNDGVFSVNVWFPVYQ